MDRGQLQVIPLGSGYAWFDTGTPDRLCDATDYVKAIELRQGTQIACIEEIAYKNGWIGKEQLEEHAKKYGKTDYGKHLRNLMNESSNKYSQVYQNPIFEPLN